MKKTGERKKKLTVELIEKLKPLPEGNYTVWDSDLRGFGVRVNRDATKTFILYYRVRGNRQQRRASLGRYGDVKLEAARLKAQGWLGEVAGGGDPAGRIYEERNIETFDQLADRYLRDYAEVHKKAGSVREDRRNLEVLIRPALGRKQVNAINQADIARFHTSLRATPIQANRCLALLSKMFAVAADWGVMPRGLNPAQGVKKFKEKKRERYLTPDELARLGAALEAAEETEGAVVVDALRLLLLTGARHSEIQRCRWEWIDEAEARIDLPDSKTGAKKILLPPAALEILKRMREAAAGSAWLIPGRIKDVPHNLQKPWERIRVAAGLEDVRIHDLRHTAASVGVSLGLGLPVIGGLLGHTKASTTQRYAHLANDPARAAAAAIGDTLSAALSARVQVIDITRPEKETEKQESQAEGGR